MLYALLLHLAIGAIAGATFKVRALVILLIVVAGEFLGSFFVQQPAFASWVLANLVAIQVGYFGAVFSRATLQRRQARGPRPINS